MAQFIRTTKEGSGAPVTINLSSIAYYEPASPGSTSTRIFFNVSAERAGLSMIVVEESYDTINFAVNPAL